jgi:endogenous inhibitor of DNA gyrase (YacG/DUF329 family)
VSPEPRTCPVCWKPFTRNGRQIYCTDRCRKDAYERRRRDTAPTPNPTSTKPKNPIAAAERDCPHCGKPVTIVALLTTPQAARPATPTITNTGVIPPRRTEPLPSTHLGKMI